MSITVVRESRVDEFRKMREEVQKIPAYVWEQPVANSVEFRFVCIHKIMTGQGRLCDGHLLPDEIAWYENEKKRFKSEEELNEFVQTIIKKEAEERAIRHQRFVEYSAK